MITTEIIHKHGISMFKPILFGLTPANSLFLVASFEQNVAYTYHCPWIMMDM